MTCSRDTVTIDGDGRTDRASLQGVVTASGVRCVKGYSVKVLTGTDTLRLGTPVRPYIIVTRHECPLYQGDTCNPLRCHVGTHGLCVRCGCWLLVVAKI